MCKKLFVCPNPRAILALTCLVSALPSNYFCHLQQRLCGLCPPALPVARRDPWIPESGIPLPELSLSDTEAQPSVRALPGRAECPEDAWRKAVTIRNRD